jgi:hypothetical protein
MGFSSHIQTRGSFSLIMQKNSAVSPKLLLLVEVLQGLLV